MALSNSWNEGLDVIPFWSDCDPIDSATCFGSVNFGVRTLSDDVDDGSALSLSDF